MKICADRQLVGCLDETQVQAHLVQYENEKLGLLATKCAVLSSTAALSAAANAVHHTAELKIAALKTAPGTAAPIFDKRPPKVSSQQMQLTA